MLLNSSRGLGYPSLITLSLMRWHTLHEAVLEDGSERACNHHNQDYQVVLYNKMAIDH